MFTQVPDAPCDYNAAYNATAVAGVRTFTYNHTGLTAGSGWNYQLVARNRGKQTSAQAVPVNQTSERLAIGCPPKLATTIQTGRSVSQALTYDDAIYVTWSGVTAGSAAAGYDRAENIKYKLYSGGAPITEENKHNHAHATILHTDKENGIGFNAVHPYQ